MKRIRPTACAGGTEFSYEDQVCVHLGISTCTLPGHPPTEGPETEAPTEGPTTTAPTNTTTTTTTTTEAPTSTVSSTTTTTTEAPTTTTTEASTTTTTPTTTTTTEAPTTTVASTTTTTTEPPTTTTTEASTTTTTPTTTTTTEPPTTTVASTTTTTTEATTTTTTEAPTSTASTTTTTTEASTTTTTTEAPTTTVASTTTTTTEASTTTVSPSTTAVPSTTAASTEPAPIELLPNGCPVDFHIHQLLPHETNCSKFYQCNFGELVEKSCGSVYEAFNPILQVCDWRENVEGCSNADGGDNGGGDNGGGDNGGGNEVEVFPNGCPVDYSNEQLLPHPDCGKFYQCVHGNKVEMSCPAGEHFNAATQRCDWPALAGCEAGSGGGDNGGGGNGDGNEVEVFPNGCPVDSSNEQLLPHADCGKFYQCVHGNKVEMSCPAGEHFNAATQRCDWPALAGCEAGSGGGDNGDGGNGGGDNGDGNEVDVFPNGCPVDSSIEQLFPHADCGKFYQCVHGNKVEMHCPSGEHFNAATQRCDWPAFSGCEPGSGGGDNGGGDNGGGDNGGGDNGGSDNGGGDNGGENEVDVFPNGCPVDSSIDQLFPHADCGKFYQCVHGDKVEMSCPAGEHFNAATQKCDWPELAGCESGSGGGDNGSGDNGGEDNGGGDNGGGDNGGGDNGGGNEVDVFPNGCPVDSSIEQLLPHADCGKFYQCVHGNKVEMSCPAGEHFNAATLKCDWPELAGCESGSGGGDNGGGDNGGGDNGSGDNGDGDNGGEDNGDGDNSGGDNGGGDNGGGDNGGGDNGDGDNGGGDNGSGDNGGGDNGGGDNGGDDNGGENEVEVLPNGCPVDSSIEQLYPHADCGKFYQCVHGDKVEMSCPPGEHFNAATQKCDWPELAGCESGSGGGDNGSGDNGSGDNGGGDNGGGDNGGEDNGDGDNGGGDNGGGDNGGEDNGDGDNGGGDNGGGDNGGEDNGDGDNGSGDNGGSDNGGGDNGSGDNGGGDNGGEDNGSGDNGGGDNGGGDNGGEDNGDGDNGGGDDGGGDNGGGDNGGGDNGGGNEVEVLPNGCPVDSSIEQLFPHADCGKFYQCVHGDKVEMSCPPGEHFNAATQKCDWPELAGCESGSGSGDNGGGDNGSGDNGGGDNGGEDNGGGDNGGEDNGGGDNGGEDNGGGDNGSGDNGGGENGGGDNGGGDNGDGDNGGGDNGGGDNGSGDGNDNKCAEGCNILPWAHDDCDKFWHCHGEQAVLVTCSEGLHFNAVTLTCDFICNAGCVREEVETTANGQGLKLFVPWDKVEGPLAELYKASSRRR